MPPEPKLINGPRIIGRTLHISNMDTPEVAGLFLGAVAYPEDSERAAGAAADLVLRARSGELDAEPYPTGQVADADLAKARSGAVRLEARLRKRLAAGHFALLCLLWQPDNQDPRKKQRGRFSLADVRRQAEARGQLDPDGNFTHRIWVESTPTIHLSASWAAQIARSRKQGERSQAQLMRLFTDPEYLFQVLAGAAGLESDVLALFNRIAPDALVRFRA